jgi:hypothetical protein
MRRCKPLARFPARCTACPSSSKTTWTRLTCLEAHAVHAAQHLRQTYVFRREIGVEPRQELTRGEMAPIVLADIVF